MRDQPVAKPLFLDFWIHNNKKFWEELIAYFPLIRHGPHRKQRVHPAVLLLLHVFIAAGKSLSSRCLATIGGIQIQAHTLMGGIYEVRRWDEFRCHDIYIKFNKNWFRHSKVDGMIHRHTQSMVIESTFFFFKMRKLKCLVAGLFLSLPLGSIGHPWNASFQFSFLI
jgi:hypothetical protein